MDHIYGPLHLLACGIFICLWNGLVASKEFGAELLSSSVYIVILHPGENTLQAPSTINPVFYN